MNFNLMNLMSDATRLIRKGELRAATAAIQAALRGRTDKAAAPPRGGGPPSQGPGAPDDWVIDMPPSPLREAAPAANAPRTSESPPERARRPAAGEFIAGTYTDTAGSRDYKLFLPPTAGEQPVPLVVMLHGCTQNPDDFAAGTDMNELALERGFIVLYPAQSQRANPQRCWNWFKHNHQQRGRGEPALLAGMTREVMARHAVDPQQVFVAGLSAGGAMAAILGEAYPELYAAVGVHSGLAAGAASDVGSAFAAMKGGGARARGAASGVPTIVFHGDADATVAPSNGEQVIAASVGPDAKLESQAPVDGLAAVTRSLHRVADGRVLGEHWLLHGAPHAWSGGNAKGSYTYPAGPDASAEMLRFFMEHPRRVAH